jgi:ATP-binding cassette subfamily B multidrug efflux pump
MTSKQQHPKEKPERFRRRPPGRPRGGPGALMMPGEKPKNFRKTLFRLLRYLKPHFIPFSLVIIFAVAGELFNVVSPKISGRATTILFNGVMDKMRGVPGAAIDFAGIASVLKTLIALYALSAVFRYFQQYIMAGISQKTVFDMRRDVSKKIARLPLKFYDSQSYGDILSRVTNDVDLIAGTLQDSIAQILESLITVVGVIIMMISINGWMTLLALLSLPLAFVVTREVAKRSQKLFAARQRELGNLNGHIEEMYGGHLIVKAFNHEETSIQEFNEINDRLYDSGWKAEFISGVIMPVLNFVNNIVYVLTAVVGGIFVTWKRIEVGDVQAFIMYSRRFTQPIIQVSSIANILQSTIAAAERVFELLDEEEMEPDRENALSEFQPHGNIRFEHVRFGYSPDKVLMQDLNIDVKSGQTVAIVGPTGAGKTTLVNLQMRFYEINGGRITIDGVDIRDLQRSTLRSIFGMVLQDAWLFQGTIRDNIAYGKIDASFEEIVEAATAAQVDHFIRTLPQGYDTVLTEEASNISQGQKQLITIARAVLADPAILILDEATSSVDTRTEILIQRAMKVLMKGRTNFVIAHRLSTVRDADLILVMSNGNVVEKGTNEELLAMNGLYADIYYSQFNTGIPVDPEETAETRMFLNMRDINFPRNGGVVI